jgi:DNA-binding response OmpR family regulator
MSAGRILLVEDDAMLRDALGEVLVDEGYDVRLAAHGAEALDELDGFVPDVIVLDLMMPVMDAFAFRAAQRERGAALDARVLILSAARHLDDAAERIGADTYLPKPFDLDVVLGSIASLLPEPGGERSAAG